MYSVSNPQ